MRYNSSSPDARVKEGGISYRVQKSFSVIDSQHILKECIDGWYQAFKSDGITMLCFRISKELINAHFASLETV